MNIRAKIVRRAFAIPALLLLALTGCSRQAPETASPDDGKLHLLATATMVADMVKAVGGERVVVDNLMGPGVDPHLFRPSILDIRRVRQSDGIFYVGLRFEELMGTVLAESRKAGQPVYALSDSIPAEKRIAATTGVGIYDPHVWFDVETWAACVDTVLQGLLELDPEGKIEYEKRAAAHRTELLELHEWALEKAAELPPEKRILVTSHDAYNYFGRAYGFQVVGLMGISTASEAGLADITRLVDLIKEKEIRAIFVESSVSHRAIERVSHDSGASIGGELYSDALGPPGETKLGFDVGTYPGMIRYNLTTIVNALR